jgi:hypothetical protein
MARKEWLIAFYTYVVSLVEIDAREFQQFFHNVGVSIFQRHGQHQRRFAPFVQRTIDVKGRIVD